MCAWLESREKGMHRGWVFLEGVETGKGLCGVKLLSNSIYPHCMHILRHEPKCKMTDSR